MTEDRKMDICARQKWMKEDRKVVGERIKSLMNEEYKGG